MARHCNITHLIDTRWSGMAKGVGTSRIVGRVHMAPFSIGGQSYPVRLRRWCLVLSCAHSPRASQCTFTILENNDMDFLLGLDMLKAHQACIDLKANVLRFGEDVSTPFLSESDIPKQSISGAELIGSGGGTVPEAVPPPDQEAKIRSLVELGAPTRELAEQLLARTNGDVEAAAGLLFTSSQG